ncbi:hypothetical protein DDB_G0272957 [Dictyostelium discoideum AX4]|uniref:Protein FRA10AC1 homolog n=1 Tax=Dictyostelium discoideum TaxID=44689 RepID=Q559E6_DICDI|nr:hypothetical protein DDB_G0272957 [Dictyostelium discoideum AX4]EAL71116.1 hypothetical protein DDB_G0272957 [Dictyostelium discoideum AX4]|eukprot:XP_644870.1 hypothetical protein DDB_G0272957 [Dictyostelium discoideum AX4]
MEINKEQYELLKKLDAVERHKKLIENYLNQKNNKNNKKNQQQTEDKYKNFKTDYQVLKENHQFLRDENENEDINQLTWEEKLAKTYYDRLYKEYAIIDLSRYKSGEIGLRWRIESEVIMGRGQFTCANKKCESSSSTSSSTTTNNNKMDDLKSFEVPFSYNELNENKVALVKVVLCPLCSKLLNYSNIKKKKKELKKFLKDEKNKNKNKNKKRKKNKNDNSEDEDEDEDQYKDQEEEEYEDEDDDN